MRSLQRLGIFAIQFFCCRSDDRAVLNRIQYVVCSEFYKDMYYLWYSFLRVAFAINSQCFLAKSFSHFGPHPNATVEASATDLRRYFSRRSYSDSDSLQSSCGETIHRDDASAPSCCRIDDLFFLFVSF